MKKKITFVTDLSKTKGGANIAALRISKILKNKFNVILFPPDNKNIFSILKNKFSKILVKIFIGKSNYLNSLNIFSRTKILESKNNILHIHWIGNEAISLDYLIKTKNPILWTMHDMWPITSTEHFLDEPNLKKYALKDCNNNFLKKKIFYKKKKII